MESARSFFTEEHGVINGLTSLPNFTYSKIDHDQNIMIYIALSCEQIMSIQSQKKWISRHYHQQLMGGRPDKKENCCNMQDSDWALLCCKAVKNRYAGSVLWT